MATDVAGIISEIQKVFGENLKNPSTVLNSFFEFLSKNDPEVKNYQKQFKKSYLIPLLKSWERLTKDIDKNSNKTTEIFNKINSFFYSFEEETKNIVNQNNKKFSNTLEEIKNLYSNDIKKQKISQNTEEKQILEQETPKIIENVSIKEQNDTETPQKEENTTKEESKKQEALNIKPDSSLINEIKNVTEPVLTNKQSDSPQEEKLIEKKTPETIISFSLPTISLIEKWIKQISKDNEENLKKLNIGGQVKQKGFLDNLMDLAKGLPMLFAAIGGASALAGFFWPEIKKYIGEKFGDKASEVFDQFQGTVNAIGKFISIGGLQVTVGKTFQTLGDLLGKVADDFASGAIKIFGGIFDNLLGVGGTAAAGAADNLAGEAVGKGLGSSLQKGGSLLFRGLSKTALKAIPLIGSVISFADAWGRFKEGEYAQGIIDIGAGLAAFVPGIGTGLSIGLSVMNAIIDFNGPEEKKELIQQTLNLAGMLTKGVGVYAKLIGGPVLKRIPFIGSMFNFASAWEKYQQNNILGGTLDLASGIAAFVPGVGLPISLGLDILSSIIGTQEAKESGLQKSGIDFAKIALKSLKFFTNLGKPFFKRLPLLGSLLSFADAWDNFSNDNILSGSLDLVSGIANLFPGIGTGLSIGIDLLNSFMSQKTESGKTRFQAVGDWFGKVWEWVKGTPVMKAFFDLYDGIEAIFMGDMPRAFKTLSNIPLIGGMFSAISKALDLETESKKPMAESKDFTFKTDKTDKIVKNLPTEYNKEEEEKLFEQANDLRSKSEKINEELRKTKESKPENRSEAINKVKKIEKLNKNLEKLIAEQSDLNIQIQRQKELKEGKTFEKSEETTQSSQDYDLKKEDSKKEDNESILQKKINELTALQNKKDRDPKRVDKITSLKKDIEELTNVIHAEDFSESSLFNLPIKQEKFSYEPSQKLNSNSGKFIFLPKEERLDTYKPNGPIDNTIKSLNENIEKLTQNMNGIFGKIEKLTLSQQNAPTSQQPTIINNNTTMPSNEKFNIMSTRDENFLARFDYIRNNSYNRVSY